MASGVGALQEAMIKFGRGLDMEELARGNMRPSFIEPMVKEEVTVKVTQETGVDNRCEGGRAWHLAEGMPLGKSASVTCPDIMRV